MEKYVVFKKDDNIILCANCIYQVFLEFGVIKDVAMTEGTLVQCKAFIADYLWDNRHSEVKYNLIRYSCTIV